MSADTAEVTFSNFRVGEDDVTQIGATVNRPGTLTEIRMAFDVPEEASPQDMIAGVAPHKTLQDNIDHGVAVLSSPEVQEQLGYAADSSPFQIARDWGLRSGLQTAVARAFMRPGSWPEHFDAAGEPDRVDRWLERMGGVLIGLASHGVQIDRVVGISSGRKVGKDESDQFMAGTTSNELLRHRVAEELGSTGLFGVVELLHTPGAGPDVMRTFAWHLKDQLDLASARILMPAVAGNWMQTGAQARTALRNLESGFDGNPQYPQLYVATDSFELGKTGQEPKTTHQNPISAIGNIVRGLTSLDEQARAAKLEGTMS